MLFRSSPPTSSFQGAPGLDHVGYSTGTNPGALGGAAPGVGTNKTTGSIPGAPGGVAPVDPVTLPRQSHDKDI